MARYSVFVGFCWLIVIFLDGVVFSGCGWVLFINCGFLELIVVFFVGLGFLC